MPFPDDANAAGGGEAAAEEDVGVDAAAVAVAEGEGGLAEIEQVPAVEVTAAFVADGFDFAVAAFEEVVGEDGEGVLETGGGVSDAKGFSAVLAEWGTGAEPVLVETMVVWLRTDPDDSGGARVAFTGEVTVVDEVVGAVEGEPAVGEVGVGGGAVGDGAGGDFAVVGVAEGDEVGGGGAAMEMEAVEAEPAAVEAEARVAGEDGLAGPGGGDGDRGVGEAFGFEEEILVGPSAGREEEGVSGFGLAEALREVGGSDQGGRSGEGAEGKEGGGEEDGRREKGSSGGLVGQDGVFRG